MSAEGEPLNNQQEILKQTQDFVKRELAGAEGGHDWFHIERVWKNACKIAEKEQADLLVVELGALLHDIADSKFHGGDEEVGPEKARHFLNSLPLEQELIGQVVQIVKRVSFKGGHEAISEKPIELQIVQDADRLDAIGAIGIARTFNYGGHKGRLLYDPAIAPKLKMSKEEYKKSNTPTINHFYEKLLLLKDRMNTATGKKMAQERHRFMEQYLRQFYREWKGEL